MGRGRDRGRIGVGSGLVAGHLARAAPREGVPELAHHAIRQVDRVELQYAVVPLLVRVRVR